MNEVSDIREMEALAWLVRVNDPAFDDWEAWRAWLDRDRRNAETYWRLAASEADILEGLRSRSEASADEGGRSTTGGRESVPAPPARRRPPRFWIAAAGVAAVLIAAVWIRESLVRSPTTFETVAGEHRDLTLADGSQVRLDGATRLIVDARNARAVTLARGRALFEVVHDEADPFTVTVGDATITDLGTTFAVTRLEDGVRIGVSEGIVRYDGPAQSQTLRAGEALLDLNGVWVRGPASPDQVSGWASGRLVYEQEGLAVIAEDLTRTLGRPVRVAPDLARRTFTGSLDVRGPSDEIRVRLELLLDVAIEAEGEAWVVRSRRGT